MQLEHPAITRTQLTGYPYSARREAYGEDALGNEVYPGDEILELNEEFFLVEPLSADAKEILELMGAIRKTAK